MIVQSLGALRSLAGPDDHGPWWPTSPSADLPSAFRADYATLYRVQPAVRVCVEFLARNIAQLALHTFRRLENDSRERLRGVRGLPGAPRSVASLLDYPNPFTSRYRLMVGTVSDLGIFGSAYWLKLGGAGAVSGLVRLPSRSVDPIGNLAPKRYEWNTGSQIVDLPPSSIVHFRWYDPDSDLRACPPLETLRRTLAEERLAGDHRMAHWRNAARIGGWIKRPKDAGQWSDVARERFRKQWTEKYTGSGNAGAVPVLEDNMEFHAASYTPAESQYLEARKLNREEVTTVYQIPLPFAGILDHATFSNIREQHKHLYMDCLGPILEMLVSDLELQLIGDYPDADDTYCEFNIAAKLAGSFEEQATAIQKLTGGPVMTRDEGRARLNLPAVGGDATKLLTPLNSTADAEADDAGEGHGARIDALERTKADRAAEAFALASLDPDLERAH